MIYLLKEKHKSLFQMNAQVISNANPSTENPHPAYRYLGYQLLLGGYEKELCLLESCQNKEIQDRQFLRMNRPTFGASEV
jgi:hypothetical protein